MTLPPSRYITGRNFRLCIDSVAGSWQANDGLIAAYCDLMGWYGGVWRSNYAWAKLLYPKATVLSITRTVLGTDGADIFDCEYGNGSPRDAVNWGLRQLVPGRKRRPAIYAQASGYMPEVTTLLEAAPLFPGAPWSGTQLGNIGRVLAQWDEVAEVPEGFVGKQYHGTSLTTGPESYDRSTFLTSWVDVAP